MTIVDMGSQKCGCGKDMTLAPSTGDEATTADGIPYYWTCKCGERKLARYLKQEDINALDMNIDLVEALKDQGVSLDEALLKFQDDPANIRLIEMKIAQDHDKAQKELKVASAKGIVAVCQHFLNGIAGTKKKTVKKADIEAQLKIYKSAVDNYEAAVRAESG